MMVPMTAVGAARITALRWSLAVVALILCAAAIVGSLFGGYVRSQLLSDRFVTATAPLAHDPQVRQLLADTVTAQVSGHLDNHALTSDINSILQHFGVGPVGAQAAAIVRPYVVNYLDSSQFDRVWTQVVTLAHNDLVTELHGGTGKAMTVEGDTLRLDIRPVVAAVKQSLVDSGISAAKAVPDVSVKVTLITSPDVQPALRDGQWFASWSPWLPVAAVGLLGLALLAAPRRRRALLVGAAILTVMFAALLAAIPLTRGWMGDHAAPRPPSTRPAVLDIFDVLAHPLITWTRIATAAALAVTLALAVLSGLARRRPDAMTDGLTEPSSDDETEVFAAAEPAPDETTVLLARRPEGDTVPAGETIPTGQTIPTGDP
jgi:hypothetical protein